MGKSQRTIIVPDEFPSLVGEAVEGTCDGCELLDKTSVVRSKPQEAAHLSNVSRNWPVSHCFHLFWVGGHTLLPDYMAQELDLPPQEVTLLRAEAQSGSPDLFEDPVEVLQGPPKVSGVDQQVVEVDHTLALRNICQEPLH